MFIAGYLSKTSGLMFNWFENANVHWFDYPEIHCTNIFEVNKKDYLRMFNKNKSLQTFYFKISCLVLCVNCLFFVINYEI